METIAFDPYISSEAAEKQGIRLVKRENLFKEGGLYLHPYPAYPGDLP